MSIDAAGILADFENTADYNVSRFPANTLVGRKQTRGSPSTVVCRMNITPDDGTEREMLPEGDRSKDVQVAISLTLLRTTDEAAKTPPDEVPYNGKIYAVRRVERRDGFCRAVLVAKDQGAES